MTAYAAVGVAFGAGVLGTCYFAAVLGARIYDAHQRGLDRVRHSTRRNHA